MKPPRTAGSTTLELRVLKQEEIATLEKQHIACTLRPRVALTLRNPLPYPGYNAVMDKSAHCANISTTEVETARCRMPVQTGLMVV